MRVSETRHDEFIATQTPGFVRASDDKRSKFTSQSMDGTWRNVEIARFFDPAIN